MFGRLVGLFALLALSFEAGRSVRGLGSSQLEVCGGLGGDSESFEWSGRLNTQRSMSISSAKSRRAPGSGLIGRFEIWMRIGEPSMEGMGLRGVGERGGEGRGSAVLSALSLECLAAPSLPMASRWLALASSALRSSPSILTLEEDTGTRDGADASAAGSVGHAGGGARLRRAETSRSRRECALGREGDGGVLAGRLGCDDGARRARGARGGGGVGHGDLRGGHVCSGVFDFRRGAVKSWMSRESC